MKYKYLILIGASLFSIASLKAQDTLATHLTYDLTAETAVGTGDYTAFQLTTNRHHVLGTRSNTAYLRGAVSIEHPFTEKLKLSATLDGIASIHADHKAYLQQCFVNLTYRSFFVEVGSREHKQVVRDDLLSSGSFVKGTNAKPIPQIHLGTNDFWTVPYTKEWLQINFDFGYGKFLDSGYREDRYREASSANRMYTTGAYYHQKHLYFRTNPEKRFFAMIGAEHVAQFGGTNYSRVNGELIEKSKPANLKAFWNVILPLGDSNYYNDDAPEDWVYGNHVGILTAQLGWNINKQHQLQVYLDDIFEDGSGIRKSNGWDGLWGLQYKNRASSRQYVRGAVFEYFQSTNQCGPLHWDSGDRPEPIRSQITDLVVGDDDYYNHMFYGSYAHYDLATVSLPHLFIIRTVIQDSATIVSRLGIWESTENLPATFPISSKVPTVKVGVPTNSPCQKDIILLMLCYRASIQQEHGSLPPPMPSIKEISTATVLHST